MKKTKPPKDREFIGLVKDDYGNPYWDFFWWATKGDGVDKACYIDRSYFDMPIIVGRKCQI